MVLMKNFIKSLSIIAMGTSFLSPVYADEAVEDGAKIKLKGQFHFQTGILNQNKLVGDEKNVSALHKTFAFYSEAALGGTVSYTLNEITAGAKIVLIPTTRAKRSASYTGSHIFIASEFGKVEMGSPYDAASKLRVTAFDVTAATGDNWGRYANLTPKAMQYKEMKPEFIDFEEYFFDNAYQTDLKQINDGTEPPRLVSYYTPKFNGAQLGFSFIPDTANTGGAGHSVVSSGISKFDLPPANPDDKHLFKINRNVKNAISGGISYEYNIDDGIDLKLGATGEYGRSNGQATELLNDDPINVYKLNDLKTLNLGANLTYGNMLYGVSYGNLFNSLTTKAYNKNGRNSVYYSLAVGYQQGPSKTSISFFKSNRFKNSVEFVTLGTDYLIGSGLQPYAEVSIFKAKGRPAYYPEAPKKTVKGVVGLLGLRLSI